MASKPKTAKAPKAAKASATVETPVAGVSAPKKAELEAIFAKYAEQNPAKAEAKKEEFARKLANA